MPADPPAAAARLWAGLDQPWREAFRQAWEALRSGNIAVGACASTPAGEIVRSARNRVTDREAPPGEMFGPTLTPGFERALRAMGEGPMTDLAHELEANGEVDLLAAMEVNEALTYLWPRLQKLTAEMS